MSNLSAIFGGGAILISTMFFLFKGDGVKGIKKLFGKNQKELENKIEELQTKEKKQTVKIQNAEKVLEEKKEKVKELIVKANKEIEETGKIKDTKKLLEEFNKW